MSIKDRFLRYRALNNLTQKELAYKLGEKVHVISRVEEGFKPHKVNEMRLEIKMNNLEGIRDERIG